MEVKKNKSLTSTYSMEVGISPRLITLFKVKFLSDATLAATHLRPHFTGSSKIITSDNPIANNSKNI